MTHPLSRTVLLCARKAATPTRGRGGPPRSLVSSSLYPTPFPVAADVLLLSSSQRRRQYHPDGSAAFSPPSSRAQRRTYSKKKGMAAAEMEDGQAKPAKTSKKKGGATEDERNSPNGAICSELRRCLEAELKAESNKFKLKAFRSAIKTLSHLPYPIRTPEEALDIEGIGNGIAGRIGMILRQEDPLVYEEEKEKKKSSSSSSPDASTRRRGKGNGESKAKRVAEKAAAEETIDRTQELKEAVALFETVPGVGPRTSRDLAMAGYRLLSDLLNPDAFSMLRPSARVAVRWMGQIDQRVYRDMVERVETALRAAIRRHDPRFEMYLVGSYRRGKASSSDIDVVLVHPSYYKVPFPPSPSSSSPASSKRHSVQGKGKKPLPPGGPETLLADLVDHLEEEGLLVDRLGSGQTKYLGVCLVPDAEELRAIVARPASLMKAPQGEVQTGESSEKERKVRAAGGIYRRIDLNLVPYPCLSAALVALTNDANMNRHLRALAYERGLHLNENGLWKWEDEVDVGQSGHENGDEWKKERGAEEGEGAGEGEVSREKGRGSNGHWVRLPMETEKEILDALGVGSLESLERDASAGPGRRGVGGAEVDGTG